MILEKKMTRGWYGQIKRLRVGRKVVYEKRRGEGRGSGSLKDISGTSRWR